MNSKYVITFHILCVLTIDDADLVDALTLKCHSVKTVIYYDGYKMRKIQVQILLFDSKNNQIIHVYILCFHVC